MPSRETREHGTAEGRRSPTAEGPVGQLLRYLPAAGDQPDLGVTPRGLRPTGAAPAYARAARAVKDDLHRTLTFRLSWPPHAAYGFTERLRPSHANRCQELRRKAMQEEYSSLPSGGGLAAKNPPVHSAPDVPGRMRLTVLGKCSSVGKPKKRRKSLRAPIRRLSSGPLPTRQSFANLIYTYCHICVSEADILGERATATLYDRRRQRAHKRLMSALKTLATVRRIARPDDTSKRHFKQKHSYRLLMCYNP